MFGPMAEEVFIKWKVNSPEDLGEIIYRLIDAKLLTKHERESTTDFQVGGAMKDLLEKRPYELKLKN